MHTDAPKTPEINGALFCTSTLNIEHKYKKKKNCCSIYTTEAFALLEVPKFVLANYTVCNLV